MLNDLHFSVSERLVVFIVEWKINPAYRGRLGTTPFQMMTVRAPCTILSVLAHDPGTVEIVEDELDKEWVLLVVTE